MPKTWQDLENIGLDKIKLSYIVHGMEQRIGGKPTLNNPEMFFHEKSKTIILYEGLDEFDAPRTLEELKNNGYIQSVKVMNNRENYKNCIFCSQLSLPWQNFIKKYICTNGLVTRKEFRDTDFLFSINGGISICLRDLVKTKTVDLDIILKFSSTRDSRIYSKIFSRMSEGKCIKGILKEKFTGTFCEMVYTVGEALFQVYKINIFSDPLSTTIKSDNIFDDFKVSVKEILESLDKKKKYWDKGATDWKG